MTLFWVLVAVALVWLVERYLRWKVDRRREDAELAAHVRGLDTDSEW